MSMHTAPHRGAGRVLMLLVALAMPMTSHAQDPTEYPAQYLGDITPVIDDITNAQPLPPVPRVAGSDLTGQIIAVAVGGIKADAGVVPGNIGPLTNLMAFCQPHLDKFLSNTEYLGPLLDYGLCIETNGAPAVLAALPTVVQDIRYIAGACILSTRTSEAMTGNYLSRTRYSGSTECSTSVGFSPTVYGQANLVDFLYGHVKASAPASSGNRYAYSTGYTTSIGLMPVKVEFDTFLRPNQPTYCPSGAACDYNWVVIANKNPNTGSKVTCSEFEPDDVLDCRMDGIPVNSTTASSR